ILDKILNSKRTEIALAQASVPQPEIERLAATRRDSPRGFAAALDAPGVCVIAEIKRASPSRGDIRRDLNPAETAWAYAAGGAAALSVLTDKPFFKGSSADLKCARDVVGLPVLRKDFIIAPYQVYESCAMGADAILLIVRILDDAALEALHGLALGLGLDVLTEVHDEQDVERANRIGATLVGINNRNLADFQTDVYRAGRMAALLNTGVSTVALSGISSADDIRRSLAAGVRRFLVGETLVRDADPASLIREWVSLIGAA
ncbi:MAG: indole-3-glycerol phosphate synthase TrpC, partial [Kiritimatiellae bacterium]|nr:indole-3-glycerol phosphate synthase TrpC [Kiritimatiellia bacterium]